ncbi:hypothetical protein DRN75_03635 [Nanoarchaeota archaeon]|nr:MAG: hypothetical protein DRN75_03635 [Nanoarchaeota archaeon]
MDVNLLVLLIGFFRLVNMASLALFLRLVRLAVSLPAAFLTGAEVAVLLPLIIPVGLFFTHRSE